MRLVSLLAITSALAFGCKSSGQETGATKGTTTTEDRGLQAFERCAAAATDRPIEEFAALRAEYALACADLYKNRSCRAAFTRAAEQGTGYERIPEICRDAYCPELSDPESAACADSEPLDWLALREAIWRHDWGPALAQKMVTRKDELGVELRGSASDLPPPGSVSLPSADGAPGIALHLTEETITLATRTGHREHFAWREEQPDQALDRALRELRDAGEDGQSAELAAEGEVSYQRVVSAMDVLIAAGFRDTTLLPVEQSSILSAGGRDDVVADDGEDASRDEPELVDPRDAPIVIVSRDSISLGDRPVALLETLSLRPGSTIPQLREALEAHERREGDNGGAVILQADRDTAATTLNAVLKTCREAGFPNVLLAVDRRG